MSKNMHHSITTIDMAFLSLVEFLVQKRFPFYFHTFLVEPFLNTEQHTIDKPLFFSGTLSSKFQWNTQNIYVMCCAIWYHLYNFKNVKNTHGGVLLKVTHLHGCFSRILNCTNGAKSRKASHTLCTTYIYLNAL